MYPLSTSGIDVGKNIAVSFPFHETHLIKDLDLLAHCDCVNRSAWIRKKIREEKLKLIEQKSINLYSGSVYESN